MADNVGITPGTGATVAADDVGGILYQRVKLALGADGAASDVSSTNPVPVAGYGELIEVLERIRVALNLLVGGMGAANADGFGRLKVVMDTQSSINTVSTVSSLTTVSSVNALGELTKLGSSDIRYMLVESSRMAADTLRSKIVFT